MSKKKSQEAFMLPGSYEESIFFNVNYFIGRDKNYLKGK
jgi:hypothetical protein